MDDIKKLLEFYKEGDRKGGFRSELQVRQAIREFVAKNDIKKPPFQAVMLKNSTRNLSYCQILL